MYTLRFRFAGLGLVICLAGSMAALTACSPAAQPPEAAAIPEAAAAAPAAEPAEAPAAMPEAAPETAQSPAAPKKVVHKTPSATTPATSSAPEATAVPPRKPMTVCSDCGVITAITPVKVEGKGTAIGVVAGGIAGIAVGNQIGGGNGKTIAKIAGAAGGALLGNKIEKKIRAETHYEVKVRFDNGTETTVTQDNEPTLAVGASVQVVNGTVVAR